MKSFYSFCLTAAACTLGSGSLQAGKTDGLMEKLESNQVGRTCVDYSSSR